MTDRQLQTIRSIGGSQWVHDEKATAVRACLEERDKAIALARRVHAECGPVELKAITYFGESAIYWKCKCGEASMISKEKINHKPDCLRLAAEAVLRKAGET